MSPQPAGDELPVRRIDRILAFMSLGMVVLSIICFAAIIIGTTAGADFHAGVWPTIGVLLYIAPIVAFLLMATLIVMTLVRRSRANKGR